MNFVLIPSSFSPAVNALCKSLELSEVKSLSLVSKEWFLATNPFLIQNTCIVVKSCDNWNFKRRYANISIDIGDHEINKCMVEFLRWFKSKNEDQKMVIRELTLGSHKSINMDTIKLLCELGSLETLRLKTNFMESFDNSIQLSFNLKEFCIHVSAFNKDNDISQAEGYIKHICENNRNIRIFHSDYLTEDSLKIVSAACPGIQSLNYSNELSLKARHSLYGIRDATKNLAYLGIKDQHLLNTETLSLMKIRKLSLIVTKKQCEFDRLLKKLPNITHLCLATIELEEWIISSVSKYLPNLESLRVLSVVGGEQFSEQHAFPKLKNLEINCYASSHLMTGIKVPSILKLMIMDDMPKEEFLLLLKPDYEKLADLLIEYNDNSTEKDICDVLERLKSLKRLNISFPRSKQFTFACLQTLCDSHIENAEVSMLGSLPFSLWKFKLFNRNWKIKETSVKASRRYCEVVLTFGHRKVVLNYVKR